MKGKEHMMIGTTATATMGIGFLMNNNIGDVRHSLGYVNIPRKKSL